MLGFDAGLFFIDAAALEDRVRQYLHDADPPLQVLVLDLEGVNYADSQGAEKLGDILELARSHKVDLRLARVKPAVMGVLERDGLIERLGSSKVHANVFEACGDMIVQGRPPTA